MSMPDGAIHMAFNALYDEAMQQDQHRRNTIPKWDSRGPCQGPRDCVGTAVGCAVCDPGGAASWPHQQPGCLPGCRWLGMTYCHDLACVNGLREATP